MNYKFLSGPERYRANSSGFIWHFNSYQVTQGDFQRFTWYQGPGPAGPWCQRNFLDACAWHQEKPDELGQWYCALLLPKLLQYSYRKSAMNECTSDFYELQWSNLYEKSWNNDTICQKPILLMQQIINHMSHLHLKMMYKQWNLNIMHYIS